MKQFIHDKKDSYNSTNRNFDIQYYKGIPLQQIDRGYGQARARRFTINNTNQNIWIPMTYLKPNGTLKNNIDIDWILVKEKCSLKKAGLVIKIEITGDVL
ncbi:hypothetical protein [Staphylococcus phage 812]|uniref:ORF114 n=2 Tax=Staphylococcus phage K TaxID=221915 RepID=Q6Y7K5_BPPGK|nr:hypothetical protein CPT_phageK_gp058 [Staphylococcus phage K]YP_009224626.1 hypothetical protein ST812_216 [Staphylococcus phage 812]AVZ44678.1 hypothetical protein [Staphylococcus phage HYZ21]QAU06209.1 hypothetical protein JSa36_207 [Staphylococcus phage J-Sa36]QBX05754.1 hypothetical protein [Staphylococcus phage vBSP-A2]URY99932.1 hypothetical protein SA4_0216 [Staphylococcus phage SA4_Green-2022a]WID30988.1 hypothetical protein [Staphylococcus phage HMGUsa2]